MRPSITRAIFLLISLKVMENSESKCFIFLQNNNICFRAVKENEDLKLVEYPTNIKKRFDKDFMKNVIWSISKISNYLIKSKEEETGRDVNKMILKSKLFSGGIQNRFLNFFSKEALQNIRSVSAITDDASLLNYLEKAEQNEEDKTMLAFIHSGTNPIVDLFVQLLEWSLKRTKPQL